MVAQLNPRFLSFYRDISRVASGVVIAVGFLVLVGWLFDISALKSILPGLATMKVNTALAFVLAGISLWLAHTRRENQLIALIAKLCAALTVSIGLLTLSEYVFGQDFDIDQLLFKDILTPENAYPGRMSPVTALKFSLQGFALLILSRHRYRWLVEVFGLAALFLSILALMGYTYGISSLYHFFSYAPIAVHTALASSILCLGILFSRPEHGLMKIFSSDNPGGEMVRRLTPAAFVLPFLLGWLLLTGQRMGLYDSTFRLALYALSVVFAFTILIWWNASQLQSADLIRQKAQSQLREAKEHEAAILYTSLDAVVTIDHLGRVLEFNPAAQKIFGYDGAEVLGKELSQLIIPPSLREQHRTGLAKYLATGEGPILGKRIELIGMRANGTEFPVELTITPITGREQPIFTGFVRDITERKGLEETRAQLAAIVESSDDAIIGKTLDGIITSWNEGAKKIYGYVADEVVGRAISILIPPELNNELPNILNRLRIGESINHYETVRLRKDGQRINVSLTISPIRDSSGNIGGASTIARDITEHKLAEAEVRKNAARTQAVADISRTLAAVRLDYQAVLDATARHTTEWIGDACAIRLVSDDGQWLGVASLYHPDPKMLAYLRAMLEANPLRADSGLGGQVIQSGQPVLIPVISPEQLMAVVPPTAWTILEHVSIHSLLVVPLRAQGEVIGTLTLTRDQANDPYTYEDQTLLQDLADRAALAIANARLYTAMQQLNNELEQRVTERTASLSQANALLQTLLDHMPDHIYFKDSRSRFIRNSRSQVRALGLSDPVEAVGKSDFDFFPHAQLSYEKEQEIIQSGKPLVDIEELVVWPNGRQTWVSTTKMPFLDQAGQIIGTFGISRDITERKQAEVALQKAKLELEVANKELEAFSYSVSHDLRSPLRSMDGYSQALLEDYGELLPTEGRNFLERIRSSAQRMGRLIDDLLDLSRVTRASMKMVPVNLSQLAQGIAAELQRTHSKRRVDFIITPNLKASGDPNLLQIVLENLLNNAWKYTSKQEQTKIEFGSKYENDENIYFVRDNGAGFDMAYANKLFGAFQRLHTATEFPGTGIGLATVQRIIHRHGGRVWAESAMDQGATFFFTLRTLEPARPEAEPKEVDSIIKRAREII